ncbi:MAG TPA: response regulator [Phycisphaerae bacterium]
MSQRGFILLVEDDPHDAELINAALHEELPDSQIQRVADGEQALDFLFRRGSFASRSGPHPTVVLLDLKLPKISGLEVLAAVKSDPVLRDIPVVTFTSSRQEQDVMRGYTLGTNSYVIKPIGFDEFVAAVRQLGGFWLNVNHPPPICQSAD